MVMILQPVVVLIAWTLAMCLWMYATRLPAMSTARVDPDSLASTPDMSLDKVLEARVQWKAHNFNHLHEAPTLFYAVCLALLGVQFWEAPLTEGATELSILLAWLYVGLRIVHSLVQAVWNKVVVRFALFSLSQITLISLTAIAALAVFSFST